MKPKGSRERPSEEPELETVLRDFDMCDQALQMAYQQFIEKPTRARRQKVMHETDHLCHAFGQLGRKVISGTDPLFVGDEQRDALIAMVLVTANNEHSRCLSDYTEEVELCTDAELAAEKARLIECFRETSSSEDAGAYADHVASHLGDILTSDWDLIEAILEERKDRVHMRVIRGLGEAAKIATAAAIGITVVEAIRRRL